MSDTSTSATNGHDFVTGDLAHASPTNAVNRDSAIEAQLSKVLASSWR